MPRGDTTRPLGESSLTGRRQRRCTGNDTREYGFGYGVGGRGNGSFGGRRGSGGGRGFGQGYGNTYAYRGRFQDTGYTSEIPQGIQPASDGEKTDISQQLSTVIDQLSKLLKQSSESQGSKDEKK